MPSLKSTNDLRWGFTGIVWEVYLNGHDNDVGDALEAIADAFSSRRPVSLKSTENGCAGGSTEFASVRDGENGRR